MSRLDSNDCANQFQVLRVLLGDYPCSDGNSVGGDTVVPDSTFEGEVGDHAQRSPCPSKKDCIVYSWRREVGKGKVISEFGACSSSLLGCGGVNAGVNVPMGQAQGDELNGLDTAHCQFSEIVGESSDWVLDRIILFCKKMGLAIEGKEMKLLSFLAMLDSLNNKANQLREEKGREQEEGDRSLFDGDLC